jgi:hypothetical protein
MTRLLTTLLTDTTGIQLIGKAAVIGLLLGMAVLS